MHSTKKEGVLVVTSYKFEVWHDGTFVSTEDTYEEAVHEYESLKFSLS